MVPDCFGPLIGIVRLALPDALLISMFPLDQKPASIGSPNWAFTSGFPCAAAMASLYGSEARIALKTARNVTPKQPPQSKTGVRQPTGTTQNQLRPHQVFCGNSFI